MDFKKILLFCFFILICYNISAQAKKPTIMVWPADRWCNKEGGYYTEVETDEGVEKIPDIKRAFNEDPDLSFVVTKIGGLMQDRGFPLKSLKQSLTKGRGGKSDLLKKMRKRTRGGEDRYSRIKAQADILLYIDWQVISTGPKKHIRFKLDAIDPHVGKEAASATGSGQPSYTVEVDRLLEEAVLNHIDNFNTRLQNYFNTIFEKGREIVVVVGTSEDWNKDLTSKIGDKSVSKIIEDWMYKNTVKGRFSVSNSDEYTFEFEQVRIPLYDEQKRAIDGRNFIQGLQEYLQSSHSIKSSLVMTNASTVGLILGE